MKKHNANKMKLLVDPGAFLLFAVSILVIPLRLLFAWILAVLIHEFGHYLALRLLKIKVNYVQIKAFGINMHTETIGGWQEIICAAAGPLAGLSTLFVSKWLPTTATFAFVHAIFNLLPIFPFDGGRIAHCVLNLWENSLANPPNK